MLIDPPEPVLRNHFAKRSERLSEGHTGSHFMPPTLLGSQLSSLQVPDDIEFTSQKMGHATQNDGINLGKSAWGLIRSSRDNPKHVVIIDAADCVGIDDGGRDSVMLRITVGDGDRCEFPDAQQCVDLIMEALARRERGRGNSMPDMH